MQAIACLEELIEKRDGARRLRHKYARMQEMLERNYEQLKRASSNPAEAWQQELDDYAADLEKVKQKREKSTRRFIAYHQEIERYRTEAV